MTNQRYNFVKSVAIYYTGVFFILITTCFASVDRAILIILCTVILVISFVTGVLFAVINGSDPSDAGISGPTVSVNNEHVDAHRAPSRSGDASTSTEGRLLKGDHRTSVTSGQTIENEQITLGNVIWVSPEIVRNAKVERSKVARNEN